MKRKNLIAILAAAVVLFMGTTIYFFMASKSNESMTVKLIETEQPVVNSTLEVIDNSEIDPQIDPVDDWKTYQDAKYGYSFRYPAGWNIVGNANGGSDYNLTVWHGDGFNKDSVQIVKAVYGTNADGSVSNRASYLKMLSDSQFNKTPIVGGQGYYHVNESKAGLYPAIYLVSDDEIFLMSYFINSSETSLAKAEELLKQIIGTFQFTK